MKSNFYLFFIVIFLIFGVLLYDALPFTYTDEFLVFILLLFFISSLRKDSFEKAYSNIQNFLYLCVIYILQI